MAGSKKSTKGGATQAGSGRASAGAQTSAKTAGQGKKPSSGAAKGQAKAQAKSKKDSASQQGGRPSVQRKRPRWPLYVVLAVTAVLLVVGGLFSWDRWLRYDDARDIQGQWVVLETRQPVTISNSEIALSDQIGYSYTIDPWEKTIAFTFGDLSGSGRYQFSADRKTLTITEGGEGDIVAGVASAFTQLVGDTGESNADEASLTTVFVRATA